MVTVEMDLPTTKMLYQPDATYLKCYTDIDDSQKKNTDQLLIDNLPSFSQEPLFSYFHKKYPLLLNVTAYEVYHITPIFLKFFF